MVEVGLCGWGYHVWCTVYAYTCVGWFQHNLHVIPSHAGHATLVKNTRSRSELLLAIAMHFSSTEQQRWLNALRQSGSSPLKPAALRTLSSRQVALLGLMIALTRKMWQRTERNCCFQNIKHDYLMFLMHGCFFPFWVYFEYACIIYDLILYLIIL